MLWFAPLFNSFSNPRLAGLYGSDYLQLMAPGLCFGLALGMLVFGRRFSVGDLNTTGTGHMTVISDTIV